MLPEYAAAHRILQQSVAMMRDALTGLPDAALDWTPAAGMSSIAVLVTHSVVATRVIAGLAAGIHRDQQAYRAEERAEAFRTRGVTTADLLAKVDALVPELTAAFEAAPEGALQRSTGWMGLDDREMNGLEQLFGAIAHLREHVGHVQVMRDLWMAGSREGH